MLRRFASSEGQDGKLAAQRFKPRGCIRHRRSPETQKARRVAGFRAQSYCSNIDVQNGNRFVKRFLVRATDQRIRGHSPGMILLQRGTSGTAAH